MRGTLAVLMAAALFAGCTGADEPVREEAGPRRRPGAPPTVPVTEPLLDQGRQLYVSNCRPCHGATGRGEGPSATSLTVSPGDLSEPHVMDLLTDSAIASLVEHGAREMPASPHIRGPDLTALVAFVRSLSRENVRTVALQHLAQREVEDFVPVTEEMLRDPPPGEWLMSRRTYASWAYSPLDQIHKRNVGELRLAWARSMESGGQYTTPLVHDGVMYLANPGDVIQALDARTGDLIWEYRRDLPGDQRYRNTRSLAILDDKIFHLTVDKHLIAIDARTGSLVWETLENEVTDGIGHLGGPITAGDKVISGRSCAASAGPELCFIAAHDAATGAEIWRTHTIPGPGEPGDETWGAVPWPERRHVGAWGVGNYDPNLNLIYWGTSVPAPSLEVLRGTAGLDVLYSNSTLALHANTGEIVWYYQHLPRDNWDMDHVFERYLIDVPVAPDPLEVPWINPRIEPGEVRRVLTGIPGKTGIIYTLDRQTGEFLWARETLYQNVIEAIDPETGRVQVNEEMIVQPFEEILVCPSIGGGKDWPAGAYSPRTGLMYQPQQNMCNLLVGNTDSPTPEDGYALGWTIVEDPTVDAEPYTAGRIDAVSIRTGRTAWTVQQRAGLIGSLVATGGGLVFGGDVDRRFMAFDDETGALLWKTIVSGPVSGSAISYEVSGRQYVAVAVGGGSASPERRVLSIHTELKPPQHDSLAIFAFGLPE